MIAATSPRSRCVALPAKGHLEDAGTPIQSGQTIPINEFFPSNTAGSTGQASLVRYVPDASNDGIGNRGQPSQLTQCGEEGVPSVQQPQLPAFVGLKIIDENGASRKSLIDAAKLHEFGYPATMLLDRQGVIRALWLGYDTAFEREMEVGAAGIVEIGQ